MKAILFCLLIFFVCFFAKGQQYYFTNDSASWKVDYFGTDPDFCWGHCAERKYYISGDTIISSIPFKKLRVTDVNYMYGWYNDFYVGAIRQNVISKKVYFIAASQPYSQDSASQILYDFNLSIGDTLGSWYICPYDTLMVDLIDSVAISNQNHARFWMTNNWNEHVFIIEGVGSGLGLLEDLTLGFGFERFDYLTCFKVGSEVLFSNLDTSVYNCELPFPVSVPLLNHIGIA